VGLLISTAGGITATVVGVIAGGVVGRRSQNRQWLQEARTAAYEKFLQAFGAVETELREAFVDRRAPAVVWAPFNAAPQSMSLVASQEAMAAAERICDIIEEFTILFHGGARTTSASSIDGSAGPSSACGFPARQVSHRGRTGLAERSAHFQGRTGAAGEGGRPVTEGHSSR
jgi:hypothetical protein